MLLIKYLDEDYKKRAKGNRSYSKRAYARDLGVASGQLSKIFNELVKPTPATLAKIVSKLKISEEEKQMLLETDSKAKTDLQKKRKMGKKDFFTPVFSEAWPFSNWLEIGLFLYIENFDFVKNENKVCQIFNVTSEEMSHALKRLTDQNLISFKDGYYNKIIQNVNAKHKSETSEIKKNLQKTFLEMAIHHIQATELKKRLNGTLTFTLNKKILPKIKGKIENFLKNINGLAMGSSENYDSIYNLTIALYPISGQDISQ